MLKKFTLHEDVQRDVDSIFDYIAADSEASAKAVVIRITEQLRDLEHHPELYSGRVSPLGEIPSVRVIIVRHSKYAHHIFFTDDPEHRRVLYIHHSSRGRIEDRHQRERRN